jgi:hypothetical protein
VAESLSDLTVAELRDLAAERGVEVPARARKADLIAALEAAPTRREEFVVLRETATDDPPPPDNTFPRGKRRPGERVAPPHPDPDLARRAGPGVTVPALSPALAAEAAEAAAAERRAPRRRPRYPAPRISPELVRIAEETRTADEASTGPATRPLR